MLKFIRDLWRGYTDADIAAAEYQVEGLPVKEGDAPYVTLCLNRREWRAFYGEGMLGKIGRMKMDPTIKLPPVRAWFDTIGDVDWADLPYIIQSGWYELRPHKHAPRPCPIQTERALQSPLTRADAD